MEGVWLALISALSVARGKRRTRPPFQIFTRFNDWPMTPSPPEPIAPLDERKFEQESAARTRELDLKERDVAAREREVTAKETELRRSRLTSPLFLALSAAAVALLGNIAVAIVNDRNTQKVEHIRAQSSLVLDAIRTGTGNTDAACKNLLALVGLGLLDDPSGTIQQRCDTVPKGPPSLPAQGVAGVSATGLTALPWDVSGYVVDESGYAISGAKVTATQSSDITMPLVSQGTRNVLATEQTDSGGAFVLRGIPLGSSYVITVEKDAFEPYSQTVSPYSLNSGISIRIILKRKK
jgi:Carboxypeptidase regulatory-like domain